MAKSMGENSMNGREALEALERAQEARIEDIKGQIGWLDEKHDYLTIDDLRAALASKDADEPYDLNKIRKRENAGPSADVPNTVPSQEGAGSAGGLAAKCGHLWHMTESEHDRMRAWEKWGREVAKPALEKYKAITLMGAHCFAFNSGRSQAAVALSALPQDAGETK
jgi:hypothetical protein